MLSVIGDITIVKMGTNEYFVHLVKGLQGLVKGFQWLVLRSIVENTDKRFCFIDFFINMSDK